MAKLFRVVQRFFHGGDYPALDRKRFAGNPRTRRRRVAAAAKLRGEVAHVEIFVFGAEADAREFRFDFLKHTRDDDRLDVADVVNQAFGFVAHRAGAGEIRFFQPEIADAVVVGELEFVVKMPHQPCARERIGLINFVADFREVRAARDEFRASVKRAGPRRGILERAGVGGNGGEQ